MPDLKIANILEEFDLQTLARRDAFGLVQTDPTLNKPEHNNIRRALIRKFGKKLGLVDIA